ncbi:MAG: 6,7-dimethyl-8-ribityllumazine synthase [Bacteroidales bacterium]|nr:6,7-dimethyl-8-ribityllumazine synthase [Candidatus Colimorpha onthohippi]
MIKKTDLSDYNPDNIPNGTPYRIAIAVAEWNPEVTEALLKGAYQTLISHNTLPENITIVHVPGSFELPTAADHLLKTHHAVICLGCVIQGETRHFDFICEAVANGLINVSIKHSRPAIFGVLTTNTTQQALNRAGGKHGNKGIEAAVAALKMVSLTSPSTE